MPYAIKKGHFLSDLSLLKKWPFIKKQKTLALLINICDIAPILFSTSPCRNFRYKKTPIFLGFDIPISFRNHPDIIPKECNHQKLTTNREQKRTLFSPSVFAFISAPHPLSQKNRKFAPTNINTTTWRNFLPSVLPYWWASQLPMPTKVCGYLNSWSSSTLKTRCVRLVYNCLLQHFIAKPPPRCAIASVSLVAVARVRL